jgi:hypothetical protein
MSRLYLSRAAVDELDRAQVELDAHLPAGSDGRGWRAYGRWVAARGWKVW